MRPIIRRLLGEALTRSENLGTANRVVRPASQAPRSTRKAADSKTTEERETVLDQIAKESTDTNLGTPATL